MKNILQELAKNFLFGVQAIIFLWEIKYKIIVTTIIGTFIAFILSELLNEKNK